MQRQMDTVQPCITKKANISACICAGAKRRWGDKQTDKQTDRNTEGNTDRDAE